MSIIANLVAVPLVVAAYLAGIVLVARMLRIRLFGVHLGMGPAVWRRQFGLVAVSVRWLPLGGSVQVEPPEELAAEWEAGPALPGRALSTASPEEKAILYSSGCAATVLLALALLEPAAGLSSFTRGFGQILGGALDPIGHGSENVRSLWRLLAHAPFLVCAGVLAAKMGAFNLLPIPALDGFHILQALVLRGREPLWLRWALNLGVVLLLGVFASYGVAAMLVLWVSIGKGP